MERSRIPNGPVFVEKDGKRIKCYRYVELRDYLQRGFRQVVEEGESEIDTAAVNPEQVYNIATVEEIESMPREELLSWALSYGLEVPKNIPSKKLVESCLALRDAKIREGVV